MWNLTKEFAVGKEKEREGEGFYDGGSERHFGIGICFDVIHTSTRNLPWKNVEEVIILSGDLSKTMYEIFPPKSPHTTPSGHVRTAQWSVYHSHHLLYVFSAMSFPWSLFNGQYGLIRT